MVIHMGQWMDTAELQFISNVHQTTRLKQCLAVSEMPLKGMVYPAEYDPTVVARMLKLQNTYYDIQSGEQAGVPSLPERVFIIPGLNACGEIYSKVVIILYYSLFYHLEELQLLDVNSEVHLFCLHFVYLSKVNASLSKFQQAWNVQSENGFSPEQLWIRGLAWYPRNSTRLLVSYTYQNSVFNFVVFICPCCRKIMYEI